jgi:hypothetical protein
VKRLPTEQLSLHPSYESLFDLPPAQDVEALAAEMRTNPQPPCHVEAEPDGTVLYGWPFVLAARTAGRIVMEVTVRQDLDGLNDFARELEVIDAHLRHGKLSPVTTARCLARAHELADFVPAERRRSYQKGDLRQVVADHLGISKRSAERYVAVAAMPRWLQALFDRGEVGIALAEKVRDLPREDKAAVKKTIDEGVGAREAIEQRLPNKRKPFVAPARDLDRFVTLGRRAVEALGPRVREVKSIGAEHARALREMKEVIDLMLQKAGGSSPGGTKGEDLSAVGSGGQDHGQASA